MKVRNHRRFEHTVNIELSKEEASMVALLIRKGIDVVGPGDLSRYITLAASLERRCESIPTFQNSLEADNYENI